MANHQIPLFFLTNFEDLLVKQTLNSFSQHHMSLSSYHHNLLERNKIPPLKSKIFLHLIYLIGGFALHLSQMLLSQSLIKLHILKPRLVLIKRLRSNDLQSLFAPFQIRRKNFIVNLSFQSNAHKLRLLFAKV